MFDLMFIVGITAAGVAATAWLLLRDTKEGDSCGGCVCPFKNRSAEVTDVETTEL